MHVAADYRPVGNVDDGSPMLDPFEGLGAMLYDVTLSISSGERQSSTKPTSLVTFNAWLARSPSSCATNDSIIYGFIEASISSWLIRNLVK